MVKSNLLLTLCAVLLCGQIHEQRLRAKGCYSEEEVQKALDDVQLYNDHHIARPGFFDTAINTGKADRQADRQTECMS